MPDFHLGFAWRLLSLARHRRLDTGSPGVALLCIALVLRGVAFLVRSLPGTALLVLVIVPKPAWLHAASRRLASSLGIALHSVRSLGIALVIVAPATRSFVSPRSSAYSTSPCLASSWLRAASPRLVSLQLARHRLALPRLARHSFAWRRVGFARYRLRTASPCPAWARAASPCLAPPRLAAATSRSVSARSASPCSASPCFISLRPCAAPSRFVLARLASPCLASLRLRAALTCSASPR